VAIPAGTYGVQPETFGLSPNLLCWIKQKDRMVVGVIGQGTSRNLTAKWDAPLEQTNAGSDGAVEKTAGAAQAVSGNTSITTFSSTQVWGGNNPLKFNLVLEFFAWDSALKQVMYPLQLLEEFASPQVNGWSPFNPLAIDGKSETKAVGRIPMRIALNIGRRMIIPECVIESVSAPIDKEKDKDGNLIRAQVTLDIQTLTMMNRDVIGKTYAQSVDAGDSEFAKVNSKSWKD